MVSEFARAIHIDIHIDMAVSDWMFDSLTVQSVFLRPLAGGLRKSKHLEN